MSRQLLGLEVDATWPSMQKGPDLQRVHSSSLLLPAVSPPLRPAHPWHRDSSRPLATSERSWSQSPGSLQWPAFTPVVVCSSAEAAWTCSLLRASSAASAQAGRAGQPLLRLWGADS